MSLWIDVTTAASCPPPATGIVRVELNLAEQLGSAGAGVRYCLYEAQLARYSEVKADAFERIVRMHRSPGCALELDIHRDDRRASGGAGIFDRADTLVTCGFNWRPQFGNLPQLYALQKTIDLRVIAMCHDLIPILFTQFVPGMDGVYAPYLRDMVRHADHILCNSRNTRRDLLNWAHDAAPATSVIPLGSEIRARTGTPVDGRVARVLSTPYLLSVGTLEHRKNQQALSRAYARLIDWGVVDLPLLVLVGQLGHGGQALIEEITADHRIRGRVAFLSGVSDDELAALYDRCLFTLYPSLYEGWGLPVSESLAAGKFCIASDRGSLPEVGGDFVDHADPCDVDAWANKLLRYLTIPGALARREREIRRDYEPTRWREAAAHVLAVAAGLADRTR